MLEVTMLKPSDDVRARALGLLRRASVRVADGNLDNLRLILPDRSTLTTALHTEAHSPSPARIAKAVSAAGQDRVLYLLSAPGRAVLAAAAAGQVDLVSVAPDRVTIRGTDYLPAPVGNAVAPRLAWGRWAVERVLVLAAEPMNQRDLARAAGITQQAASKILRSHPAVLQSSEGWRAESTGRLLDTWTREYPGVDGVSTHWYHLDPVTQQARLAADVARQLEIVTLGTGDIAADEYAPWRLPSVATVYVGETIDLTVADFVPAEPGESTLVAQIPRDPTLWSVAKWYAAHADSGVDQLVDPVLALWDVMHSPGSDASDAAQHLREAIVSGRLRA